MVEYDTFIRSDSTASDNSLERSTECRVSSYGDWDLHLGESVPPSRICRLIGNQHGLRQNGSTVGFEPNYI